MPNDDEPISVDLPSDWLERIQNAIANYPPRQAIHQAIHVVDSISAPPSGAMVPEVERTSSSNPGPGYLPTMDFAAYEYRVNMLRELTEQAQAGGITRDRLWAATRLVDSSRRPIADPAIQSLAPDLPISAPAKGWQLKSALAASLSRDPDTSFAGRLRDLEEAVIQHFLPQLQSCGLLPRTPSGNPFWTTLWVAYLDPTTQQPICHCPVGDIMLEPVEVEVDPEFLDDPTTLPKLREMEEKGVIKISIVREFHWAPVVNPVTGSRVFKLTRGPGVIPEEEEPPKPKIERPARRVTRKKKA